MQVAILLVLIEIHIFIYCLIQKIQRNEKREKHLLQQQNRYYRTQYLNSRKQWKNVQKMYHDMRNMYVLELGYLKKQQYDLLQKHYESILGELKCENTWIDTGSLGIDSILNYKREWAKELGISIKIYTRIMGGVTVKDEDLIRILGNLIDNAIEAVERLEVKDREIRLSVKSDKTALLIHVSNKYIGNRTKDRRGDYVTGKRDKKNHGIGLKTINSIVKKYKGNMETSEVSGEFHVHIFMYMPEN